MLRWSVLAVALLVNAPVVWRGFVDQTVSVETVLVRLLITIPVAAVLLAFLRTATRGSDSRR